MTDVKNITADLVKLDSQLDSLEDALEPLLRNLRDLTSQLPLLDKAKLFSLTAYSIESLLFSYLKLQGTDAQNHAVYEELRRVQQYFGKIKAAEQLKVPDEQRRLTVDQEAVARILKSDLNDNKTLSTKLAEKIAEERAKALLKSVETRKRPAEQTMPSSVAEQNNSNKKHRKREKSKIKK